MTPQPADPLSYARPDLAIELSGELTRILINSMSVMNQEMARFIAHRLQMEAKLQRDLTRARTMFDAYDAMARFWQGAFADYSKEARTLQGIAETAAQENLTAATSRADVRVPPLPE